MPNKFVRIVHYWSFVGKNILKGPKGPNISDCRYTKKSISLNIRLAGCTYKEFRARGRLG